jgi:hypothetical protein
VVFSCLAASDVNVITHKIDHVFSPIVMCNNYNIIFLQMLMGGGSSFSSGGPGKGMHSQLCMFLFNSASMSVKIYVDLIISVFEYIHDVYVQIFRS